MESEASAERFTIDHYEPVKHRPELRDDYGNLMYCCDSCNMRKGARRPTDEQRRAGRRFFRADSDVSAQHYKLSGRRITHLTPTGEFTILALSLNRDRLLRLRDIRSRILACDDFISAGIEALRSYPIDSLPAEFRQKALRTINAMAEVEQQLVKDLDELLRNYAASPLQGAGGVEDDSDQERERLEKLRQVDGLSPGAWRGRKRRGKA